MLTHFDRPEEGKEPYFKLSSSFQIIEDECSSTYKFAGLYAIYKNEVCYYVGQSKNLASRISQHIKGKYESADKIIIFSPWLDNANFYNQTKEVQKALLDQNEMLLMQMLKPIENLITPPDDFDPRDDFTFESLKHGMYETFFDEMTSMSVILDNHYISVVYGDGKSYCNFDGKAFAKHNEYVVYAYKAFGDDAFDKGVI